MKNKLIKYDVRVIKRVGIAIDITNKLIKNSPKQHLQLNDSELYKYNCIAKEELFEFIKVNLWYFLGDIIQKEKMKAYTNMDITIEILDKIRYTKFKYEFPRCSFKERIEGEGFDKIKNIQPYDISLKLEKDFQHEILSCVCPSVAGKFLSHFIGTSIGFLTGIEKQFTKDDFIEQLQMLKKEKEEIFRNDAPRIRKFVLSMTSPLKPGDVGRLYRWLFRKQITLNMLPNEILNEFKHTRQYSNLLKNILQDL